jgi:hypothetical protein
MENNDLIEPQSASKRACIEANYSFIFRLILPVVTTIVERAFLAINIVKNRLRNRMGD